MQEVNIVGGDSRQTVNSNKASGAYVLREENVSTLDSLQTNINADTKKTLNL